MVYDEVVPRPDLVSLSNHPFSSWRHSLASLADELDQSGHTDFLQRYARPFLILAHRPSSSLESDWEDSETELSMAAGSGGHERHGYGSYATEIAKGSAGSAEPKITVGRAPGSDILIRSSKISKKHAGFDLDRQRYYLVDLGSANGSWVNAKRLAPGKRQRLRGGERITLWRYQFEFILPDALVRLLERQAG